VVDHGGTTAEADLGDKEDPNPLPLDPDAVERAYRFHRARRRARIEHRRARRLAGVRFWLVVLCLVVAAAALGVVIVQEVQRLFGV
jgi:hypothetical protein